MEDFMNVSDNQIINMIEIYSHNKPLVHNLRKLLASRKNDKNLINKQT